MKTVPSVRLFRIVRLVLALAAGATACDAGSPLLQYERVLYLPPPPTYSDAEGLLQGTDGRLYGTLHSRANSGGALFRMEPNGAGYTVIFSSPTNRPSGVIEGSDGRLYGTIAGPSITNTAGVFCMDRDGGNFTMVRTFSSDRAHFGVVQDGDGWLYGTTTGDGLQNGGSLFKMSTNGAGFEVLHQFGGMAQDDGLVPGALTLGRDGVLYGCTFYGGFPDDEGTVFKAARDGSDYSVLHRFEGGRQGLYPASDQPLLEGSDGFLYGAAHGGANRAGILFKVNKRGEGFQVIHEFAGERGMGELALGGLVEWCDGALYGATHEGGIDGAGTLFRINKDGSGYAVLRVYIDAPNPGDTEGTPRTSLVPAADGWLYGITSGGSVAEGTVYRINPLPALDIRPGSEGFVLSWPVCRDDYALEESTEPGTVDGWKVIENAGEVDGALRRVQLPGASARHFFRLVKR